MKQVEAIRKGEAYDMLSEMKKSGKFNITDSSWDKVGNLSTYTGRASEQTEEMIKEFVDPILEKNKEFIGVKSEIRV